MLFSSCMAPPIEHDTTPLPFDLPVTEEDLTLASMDYFDRKEQGISWYMDNAAKIPIVTLWERFKQEQNLPSGLTFFATLERSGVMNARGVTKVRESFVKHHNHRKTR